MSTREQGPHMGARLPGLGRGHNGPSMPSASTTQECFPPRGLEPHGRGWWRECGDSMCVCISLNAAWIPVFQNRCLSKAASPASASCETIAEVLGSRQPQKLPRGLAGLPPSHPVGEVDKASSSSRDPGLCHPARGPPPHPRGSVSLAPPPGILGSSATKDGGGGSLEKWDPPPFCPSVPRAWLSLSRACMPRRASRQACGQVWAC